MQGERSILDSFPETSDLNQGSGSNNATMDRSTAWDNLLNPVENRLSNYVLSSGEGNLNSTNPADLNAQTLSGWDHGESSSSANAHNQLSNDLKIPHGWSSSSLVADRRSADWRCEPSNILLHESGSSGYGGNYLHRPLNLINSGSTHSSLNANMSEGHTIGNSCQGRGSVVSSNMYTPGGSETGHFPTFDATSDNSSTCSGSFNYLVQNEDGLGSSSSTWGLSCKRKALEGSPGQSCPSGSLCTNPQDESVGRHTVGTHYNASSGLTLCGPPVNSPSASYPGHLNPRIEGRSGVANDGFRPLRVTDVAESSHRNFGFRATLRQQESVALDLSAAGTDIRHSSASNTCHPSRFISAAESLDPRPPFSHSMVSNSIPNQSHLIQVPVSSRSMPPFPWDGSLSLRGGSSSGTISFFGERGTSQDEATFRNSQSSAEHSGFVSPPETRHLIPEPPNRSFIPGSTSSSRNVPFSSRINPGSSSRSFPTVWIPHQNPASHTQQRLPEFPQWTLFPAVEPEPGGQIGHLSSLPSAPSSSEEAVMSSGSRSGVHSQPYSRSFFREMSNEDMNGWRALAADIEGRHRLVSEIRQVRNAMRRAENLRAEDYIMFDPFIGGVAQLHDRHRDMRLNVDNMSYEELLALEERIGNVSTGLSEETILQSMKQQKYQLVTLESSSNLEPCCVCQEDYITGDDLGTLDCGHVFHTNCIKQWLTLKNLCPICKMAALKS